MYKQIFALLFVIPTFMCAADQRRYEKVDDITNRLIKVAKQNLLVKEFVEQYGQHPFTPEYTPAFTRHGHRRIGAALFQGEQGK